MSLYLSIAALLVAQTHAAAHMHHVKMIGETGMMSSWKAEGPGYQPIAAKVGEKVMFHYNAYHDVQKMSDSSCGNTGNTEMGNNSIGGGTTAGGGDTNKYVYTVTAADLVATTIYFSCSYYPAGSYAHCGLNQTLTVTVSAGAARTAAPSHSGGHATTAAPTAAPAASGAVQNSKMPLFLVSVVGSLVQAIVSW